MHRSRGTVLPVQGSGIRGDIRQGTLEQRRNPSSIGNIGPVLSPESLSDSAGTGEHEWRAGVTTPFFTRAKVVRPSHRVSGGVMSSVADSARHGPVPVRVPADEIVVKAVPKLRITGRSTVVADQVEGTAAANSGYRCRSRRLEVRCAAASSTPVRNRSKAGGPYRPDSGDGHRGPEPAHRPRTGATAPENRMERTISATGRCRTVNIPWIGIEHR